MSFCLNRRYEEGRRQWSTMTKNIRSLALNIWVCVTGDDAKGVVDRKSAINLCLAFAVSVKHYLREEYSDDFEDLKDLVAHIKRTAPQLKPTDVAVTVDSSSVKKRKSKQPDKLLAYDLFTPTNIPMAIITHLNSYIVYCSKNNLADLPTVIAVSGSKSFFYT